LALDLLYEHLQAGASISQEKLGNTGDNSKLQIKPGGRDKMSVKVGYPTFWARSRSRLFGVKSRVTA
jgi:hypothetical protein